MKLSANFTYGIIASIFLVSAPHAEHLPWWVSVTCGLLFAWRTYLNYSNSSLPPRLLLLLITVAGVAGILISFHTLFGRQAGVALLILLSSLKLLELRSMRDATVLLYIACFIIITNFFNSQSIPTALFMLFTLLVMMTTWIQIYTGTLALKPRIKMAGQLLLQAIPLTLILFVLFPRIEGPLWGLPQDANASSGLSDSMSPGSFSKLSLSQAVAFRVAFTEGTPAHEQMYWRGPVLADFDGASWRTGLDIRRKIPQIASNSPPLSYTVTLEPHNKLWLFALDIPNKISIDHVMTDDFQLQSKDKITSRIRYQAQSQLTYRVNIEESEYQLKRNLNLPTDFNPRARQLAAAWRNTLPSDEAIIQAALQNYQQEKFSYTLEPPLLGKHSVDDFLFETRLGFCEHYASSFVFLMRAAGIPARVVTGYQGGEPNELGGYTIVRQSDAHAWAEVWLKERGWLRIDPTSAISPERILNGLSAALPDSDALPFMARIQAPWLRDFRFGFDRLNHNWNQWVLGYNPERQFAFLTRLGMEDVSWQKMAINLLIGIALLVGIFALILLRKLYTQEKDPALILYLKFCKKLAKHGIVRATHEGAKDFAQRAAQLKPQLADSINDITSHYLALRYQNEVDAEALGALRRAVVGFKVGG
jgi:transglutaminase-like putative cysteine protease